MFPSEKSGSRSVTKSCRTLDTSVEYGETYPNIEISYEEQETDEEVVRRIQIERERARLSELKERGQLKALQSKYEKATPND